jgi:hypothetical protein
MQPVDVDSLQCSVWVNEEVLLVGLDMSHRAISFLYAAAPEHRGWTVLVGHAYLIGLTDNEGDTQDCPEHVIRVFLDQPDDEQPWPRRGLHHAHGAPSRCWFPEVGRCDLDHDQRGCAPWT